jgi:hypothetical protein
VLNEKATPPPHDTGVLVMRVGVTGHRSLPDPAAWSWVEATLRVELARLGTPLVGLSSLAIGSDQLFARLVLEAKGSLEVVVPFPAYRDVLPDEARGEYDRLLGIADRVVVLPAVGSPEEGYLRAGHVVVRESELLVAVWDRQPERGIGGTAAIAEYATSLGRSVVIVDPIEHRVLPAH